jgi:hypothetical protein
VNRKATLAEAEKLRAEIAEAETKVKALKGQIRHREGRLRRFAADAFNDVSEPLSGMAVPTRNVDLGRQPCAVSPIGVCAFDRLYRVAPLPVQQSTSNDERFDACLFCGKRNPQSIWRR